MVLFTKYKLIETLFIYLFKKIKACLVLFRFVWLRRTGGAKTTSFVLTSLFSWITVSLNFHSLSLSLSLPPPLAGIFSLRSPPRQRSLRSLQFFDKLEIKKSYLPVNLRLYWFITRHRLYLQTFYISNKGESFFIYLLFVLKLLLIL